MKIAVASGKGGTGKTTVSGSLVSVWPDPVVAVDLDVEAPNLHLFLRPEIVGTKTAVMDIPVVDESKCNQCRACAETCQFKAISVLGEVVLVFDEMCHGCGACLEICPENALSAGSRVLGEIQWGQAGKGDFLMGRLRIGEAMSPPLMRAVKTRLEDMLAADEKDVIIDAPPGVSCPAVNAVMDADVVLLVTEPTPFGLYDLQLAHDAFVQLEKPMGVVINRAGIGFQAVHDYCQRTSLPILAEIPYHRRIAEAYAAGRLITNVSPDLKTLLTKLSRHVRNLGQTYAAPREVCSHG